MADSEYLSTSIILNNNNYKFKATGSIMTFDGYLKVYSKYEDKEDIILPDLKEKECLISKDIISKQHFTEPPSRYTESSLIKELESLGIGRPSTYATIIDTIKSRGYVILDNKKFVPTDIGIETTDKLQEYFSGIVNVKYTANMESDLDKIADNKLDNIKVLSDFYNTFEPLVENAFKVMERTPAEETGEICPNCGNPLVVRKGKYGKFVACSNYPECKYVKKEKKEVKEIMKCPKCGGSIVERKTRKGKAFYGCSGYPKCRVATWFMPTGKICPNCGSLLVDKKGIISCNDCSYTE